jgi:hypothetical protein
MTFSLKGDAQRRDDGTVPPRCGHFDKLATKRTGTAREVAAAT